MLPRRQFCLDRHRRKVLVPSKAKDGQDLGLPAAWEKVSPWDVGMDPHLLRSCDQQLHKMVDKHHVPGVVSIVVRRGKLVHYDEYGYSDLDKKTKFTMHTLVRMYSLTKIVTASAVMLLKERGLLNLDTEVSEYIPSMKQMYVQPADEQPKVLAKSAITIRQLMTHTCGMSQGPGPEDPFKPEDGIDRYKTLLEKCDKKEFKNLEEWIDFLAQIPLYSEPGSTWEYGYGADILGRIVEIVSKMSLDAFLQAEFFNKLGMRDTSFSVPKSKADRLSTLYRQEDYHPEHTIRIKVSALEKYMPVTSTVAPVSVASASGARPSVAGTKPRNTFTISNLDECHELGIVKGSYSVVTVDGQKVNEFFGGAKAGRRKTIVNKDSSAHKDMSTEESGVENSSSSKKDAMASPTANISESVLNMGLATPQAAPAAPKLRRRSVSAKSVDAVSSKSVSTKSVASKRGEKGKSDEKGQGESESVRHDPNKVVEVVLRERSKKKRLKVFDEAANSGWVEPNQSPLLTSGVETRGGGLISTAADFSRFAWMLLNDGLYKGGVGGSDVRILKTETVREMRTNHLPQASRNGKDLWLWGKEGLGYGSLGSIAVPHKKMDLKQYVGEYGWGG